MKKVLVFGMTENPGGVEAFLMNYYRKIDRSALQFDFLCNSHRPIAFEEEIHSLGGKTYHITARSRNPLRYRIELTRFFRKHAREYDAIWVNVNSLANIDYLMMAKRYGIKRRIIHSHNSRNMDSALRGRLHLFNQKRIGRLATAFWACSSDAADWFYQGEVRQKAVIIHNAIDVMRCAFHEEKRHQIREAYHLDTRPVIGNIGRLHFQKNQRFLLEIFAHIVKKKKDAILVLVGQGDDEAMLRSKARELGIDGQVLFAGVQTDIQAWLSAFDLFLFPSAFEGLGIAALEAQANGVPVIASAVVIPKEVKINSNVAFCSLDRSAREWAEQAIRSLETGKREDARQILEAFQKAGYEIGTEAVKLEKRLVKQGKE